MTTPATAPPSSPRPPLADAGRLLSSLGLLATAAALTYAIFGGGGLARDTEPSLLLFGAALSLLAASLTLLGAWWRHDLHLPPPLATAGLALWLAASALSCTVAEDPFRCRLFTWQRLGAAALLLAAWQHTRTRPAHLALTSLLLAACLGTAGLAARERWIDLPAARARYAADPEIAAIDPELRPELEARLAIDQASGPFLLPNGLGAMQAMGTLLATAAALAARQLPGPALRTALALLAATLLGSIALSGQKGSWLALAIAATALLPPRHRAARLAHRLALALALALLLAVTALPTSWLEHLPGATSFAVRREYATSAWALVREHPVRGVGAGNFAVHMPRHKPPRAEETRFVHDDPLETLTETGPLGLLGLALLWFGLLRPATRPPAATENPPPTLPRRPAILAALGAAAGLALCIPLGAAVRQPATIAALAAGLALLTPALTPLLARLEPSWLRRGALAAALAFCVQSLIDFLHAEPGLLATALTLAALAAPPDTSLRPGARTRPLPALLVLALTLLLTASVLPTRVAADNALHDAESLAALGRPHEALATLERARSLAPDDPATALAEAAAWEELARQRHDPRARRHAIELYRRFLSTRHGFAAPRMRLAALLEADHRPDEALRWLRSAVRANPTHPRYQLALARALADRGDITAAAHHARLALAYDRLARSRHVHLDDAERRLARALAGPG